MEISIKGAIQIIHKHLEGKRGIVLCLTKGEGVLNYAYVRHTHTQKQLLKIFN